MLVKLVQGDNLGDPPKVIKPLLADYTSGEVALGIVYFVADDDLAVDFILDPTDSSLTLNTGSDAAHLIADGDPCTFWYDGVVAGYHSDLLDASLDVTTAREAQAVAFDVANAKLGDYDSGATNERDTLFGYVYMNEGVELTVMFTAF
jgi:hypothetical protein